MSDLINREDAIKIVQNRCKRNTTGCVLAVSEIKQLPPAELSTNLAEVGTDAVSRQKAIEIVEKYFEKIGLNGDICVDGLRQLQPIHPEIVRCEECKYHHQRNCPIEKYFSFDGFCSRGKRREVTT